jgi:hypothetical protein
LDLANFDTLFVTVCGNCGASHAYALKFGLRDF